MVAESVCEDCTIKNHDFAVIDEDDDEISSTGKDIHNFSATARVVHDIATIEEDEDDVFASKKDIFYFSGPQETLKLSPQSQ